MARRLVCVGFDGVLHSDASARRSLREIVDRPVPGAIEGLLALSDYFDVAIFSRRSRSWFGRRAMRTWLTKQVAHHYALIDDTVRDADENYRAWWRMHAVAHRVVCDKLQWPSARPDAWVTIDDRCMRFDGQFPSVDEVSAFAPWYARMGGK